MGTFVICKRLPKRALAKYAKETARVVREWFDKHPRRKDCLARLWCGQDVRLLRATFEQQIKDEAAKG